MKKPFKPSDIIKICAMFAIALVLCATLVFGYLSGKFVPALVGVGFIVLMGSAIAACI